MVKCKILRSKDELGSAVKKVFYEAKDKEAYKPITIKINEELKNFLEQTKGRHGIDKEFLIPGSSTLNNLLVVRVEDIRSEDDYYECDLLVQFFAEKEDFKDLMELEERIKGKLDEGLTDLEKAEFLNTYINENISYDKEHRSRSALAAAISHKGTCVAFSQLFQILGEAVGLKVGCISSNVMKHRWNYVIIGDETYYIDTTFNATNNKSKKLFFQTSPIHLERGADQKIAVPIIDQYNSKKSCLKQLKIEY